MFACHREQNKVCFHPAEKDDNGPIDVDDNRADISDDPADHDDCLHNATYRPTGTKETQQRTELPLCRP